MNVKIFLRNNIARFLHLLKFTAPAWCNRGHLSIVTFHRVLPEANRQAYPFPDLVITPEELDAFLTYFTEHFDCGSLKTQHERFLSGEISARPLLAITFDDAQYDNYSNARPILARHQIKASFFAPVEAIKQQKLLWHDRLGFAVLCLLEQSPSGQDRLTQILTDAGLLESKSHYKVENILQASKMLAPKTRLRLVEELVKASGTTMSPEFARLMTFDELAELAAEGHEIGSHSMTHCLMPECDDRALTYETAESRRELQMYLGQPIETFCYPNGNYNTRTANAVAQAGYRRAVTTTWGYNSQVTDRFQLRRFNMVANHVQDSSGRFMPALIAFRMSGYYPSLNRPGFRVDCLD